MNQHGRNAFSLIEVVVATAIFAVSIVAIVGLMAPMSQRVEDVIDSEVSARLSATIEGELKRLGFAEVSKNDFISAMGTTVPEEEALVLVSNQSGSRTLLAGGTSSPPANNRLDHETMPGIAIRDRYFRIRLVLVEPFNASSSPSIFIRADVSWPFYVPTGPPISSARTHDDDPNYSEVPAGQRQTLSYFFAIRR